MKKKKTFKTVFIYPCLEFDRRAERKEKGERGRRSRRRKRRIPKTTIFKSFKELRYTNYSIFLYIPCDYLSNNRFL